ncbi:MAG: ABC transporter substrate-binding protein [Acidobacteriota bacterium]|nr:ABC transporter substrate-binding protein [Acidobacteriota bacterium]
MSAGVALALLMTACGARVGPYLGASQGVGGGGGATQGSTDTGPAGTGPVAGPASGPAGPSPAAAAGGGGTPNVAAASQFDFTPQTEAGACQGAAGNTASAPGITPNSVTFGNVSGLTGPLSGSFTQGAQGVQALFDAVDAAGGICGRKLALVTEDDQQNASTNESDVQGLIAKPVFAFAGSTSDADNGGVPDMTKAGIPDFGFAINCIRSESSTYWSPAGGSCYQPQGPGQGPYAVGDGTFALDQQQGYLPKKMAFLAYSIPISAQAAQQFAYVYQHTFGGDVCYQDTSISPVSASLESDVEQMQSNGCQGVYTFMDVTGNSKLLQALQQQNVNLGLVGSTFDSYTPVQIQTAGQSASQKLTIALPFIPLSEHQHMDDMYQSQLKQYVPGAQPSGFGFLAWLAAQMMIYAVLQAGRNPTWASLDNALNGLKNFDDGGAVGPYSPGSHGVAPCTMDVWVQGSDFVRRSPSSGLFCGGQTVQASP